MRLGFEREGMPVESAETAAAASFDDVAVVIAGADPHGDGDAAPFIRELVAKGAGAAPLLYVGNGISRGAALAAGATAMLASPAYVRDVVTIGRILAGRRPGNRSVMDGDLGQSFGVFYLVRALSRTGATGTLLMLRGLRRGEIRFFEGEVTSAQVGGLHGQAALDQLLLWTEARFELRDEPVVRRQQIPLTLDELLGHAERFLCDLRDAAGSLSPSAVYEQDAPTLASMGRQLPTEVHGVLRMFDGHRTVADVLEDSPFRVLETLRVAERAAQVGLLKKLVVAKQKNTHRAMLAVEEWLVGGASGEVAKPLTPEGSGPVGGGKKKGKGKNSGVQDAVKPRAVVEVDWAALVPRGAGLDAGALSPVVPSSAARGEIEVRSANAPASRDAEREKLETLTDAGERDRLFAPLVEIAERETLDAEEQEWLAKEKQAKADAAEAAVRAKREKEEGEAKAKADAEAKAKREKEEAAAAKADAKAKVEAEAKAKADAEAKAKREKEEAAAKAKADAKAKAEADAKAKADAVATVKREKEEAAAKAKGDAKAKAEADAKAKADSEAKAEAEERAKAEQEEADEWARKAAVAMERADAEAKAKADVEAKAKADGDAKAKADVDGAAQAKDANGKATTAGETTAKTDGEKRSGEIGGERSSEHGSERSGEIGGRSGDVGVGPSGEIGGRSGEIGGELRPARATTNPDVVAGPSILVDELVETRSEARSIGEAATHAADAAATAAKKDSAVPRETATPTGSGRAKRKSTQPPAGKSVQKEVDRAHQDAQAAAVAVTSHFSDDEEAFFQAGHSEHHGDHKPAESFDDLDDGYQRVGFWDRLVGRKPAKPPPKAAAKKSAPKKPGQKR
ncbi:MAG TPA: DUF4388 domain-containing protein [Kofleriaceae bacterium]|nr:DUF4388 domain-containing protein [Kofleriaceae bacterium]